MYDDADNDDDLHADWMFKSIPIHNKRQINEQEYYIIVNIK